MKKSNKKTNKKGFTLIELLAVIVIMGILMLVAIPAITKYIENSKKKTYVNTVKEYVNAVKNAYNGDRLDCSGSGPYKISFANAKALLDSGGSSPYNNGTISGDIQITPSNSGTTYTVIFTDSGNHGISNSTAIDSLTYTDIKTSIAADTLSGTACTVKND